MNLIDQIILSIVMLFLCGVVVEKMFPDRNKVKQLPPPSNLSYENLKDMHDMCAKHGFYRACEAFYFDRGGCQFDYEKYKNGLKKDIALQSLNKEK